MMFLALAGAALPAAAQPCGARASFRLENAMTGPMGIQEVFAGTNVWAPPPLALDASNTNWNALGMQSSAWGSSRADYGDISFAGGGSGNNAPGNGCFLWIDEVYGAAPKAEVFDRLTISSTTLPAGTPVQVRVTMRYYGGAVVLDENPYLTYSAEVIGSASLSGSYSHIMPGPGVSSFIVTSNVGGTVDLWQRLYLTMKAQSLAGAGSRSATMHANFRLITEHEVLTAGAVATSCAGGGGVGTPCLADLDNGSGNGVSDGGVTIDDLIYFLGRFEAGDASVDLDDGSGTGTPDQGITIDDLIFFLTRFEGGC
jgi:hypothetical protein